MTLLDEWKAYAGAYTNQDRKYKQFWTQYFTTEKEIYEKLLEAPETITAPLRELAEKYDIDAKTMTGFISGINDSLKTPYTLEELTEDTVISLDYDREKLYYNMVAAGADWLYNLPQWDALLSSERRKELYKEQKTSRTVVNKEKKPGRNDPCPCGSGLKYKKCCGK